MQNLIENVFGCVAKYRQLKVQWILFLHIFGHVATCLKYICVNPILEMLNAR